MKNKKLLYLLIPLTVLLWGSIVYKVLNAASGEEEAFVQARSTVSVEEGSVYADTFSISCNYPDPFVRESVPKTSFKGAGSSKTGPVKKVVVDKKKPNVTESSWPDISYKGIIRNQKSSKQLALISVDGQSTMMKTGEIYANVQLLRVFKDSVEVKFGKEKKCVRK